MTTMYIAEFSNIIYDKKGRATPVAQCPPIAEQVVDFSSVNESAAFNNNTAMVRIVCDDIAHLAFGTDPVANSNNAIKVEADIPEYFGVFPGQKVSAVQGS